MFFGSILVAWILILRLPVDYLSSDRRLAAPSVVQPPFLRISLRIGRNLFGILLVTTGLVMLLTPGQGILFILLGAMMVDFPNKHRFIQRHLERQQVLSVINRVRQRAGKPSLDRPTAFIKP